MLRARYSAYNRGRLTAIVIVMLANLGCGIVSVVDHHYPLALAPLLLLMPGLRRELDLRRGRPLRPLGLFEWSCFVAGFFFLAVLPLLLA